MKRKRHQKLESSVKQDLTARIIDQWPYFDIKVLKNIIKYYLRNHFNPVKMDTEILFKACQSLVKTASPTDGEIEAAFSQNPLKENRLVMKRSQVFLKRIKK